MSKKSGKTHADSPFILDSSEMAQWHTLVQDAEQDYGCHLDEAMQSYLVFTLMRFARDSRLNAKALALDFLQSQNLPHKLRSEQLRDIGDQCLLVSGLYPQTAQRRQVSISYYVDMGRSAYHHISGFTQQGIAELYRQLAESFVLLMDLLQTIRGYSAPALEPLAALDLWQKTGSRTALEQVTGKSLPLPEALFSCKHKH
ncbi:MAG TPA: hypothetical protein ENJ11_05215 [Gammaproteobacteria bacterium]|nr:hypothetical protein [Gammaproteobacteria bacterium]